MREYGLSLTRIFPYKDTIVDSIILRDNKGQQKTVFSHNLHSVKKDSLKKKGKENVCFLRKQPYFRR